VSETPDETCPKCGGRELDRLPSRFAVARSAESRLDALAEGAGAAGIDEEDPRSVARWMKRMGSELGDEVGAEGLDELADEIESAADEPADDL
jgi:hypothetical protein